MNKIFKSVLIVTVLAVATRLLSFIFKIYLSRAYGADTVGLYQMCLSVLLLLLSVSIGGFPTVLSRKIAECEAKCDYSRQNALLTASVLLSVLTSALIVAFCFLFKNYLNFLFSDDRCGNLFLIMIPALLSSSIYCSIRAWLNGKKRFFAFSFTELLEEIFKIAFTAFFSIGLVAQITGATAIAVAFTVADVLCAVILIIIFLAQGGRFSKPSGFLELYKSGVPLTTLRISTSLVSSLTALVVPMMLIKDGVQNATALYGVVSGMALPLITAPTTIIGSLAIVLIPDMAQANVLGDTDSIKSKLSYTILFSVFVCSLFFIMFTGLGEELGLFLFDDVMAGEYVKYTSGMMFLIGINASTTTVLNSLGLERKTLLSYFCGIAVFIPLIFLLPSVIGIYSIAVASASMSLVCITVNFIILKKKVGAKLEHLSKNLLLLLFTAPCIALTVFLKGILCVYLSPFFVILFASLISLSVYMLLALSFNLLPFKFTVFKRKKNNAKHSFCRNK